MKIKASILMALIALFAAFTGCEEEGENLGQSGTVKLSLTDAPVDDASITGVYITITGIQYHKQQKDWETIEFEEPQKHNLLELQDSISVLLGDFEMEAGQYTQLRFMLDAAERGQGQGQGRGQSQGGPQATPGCYLEYEDGTTQDLFVPSGGQTGYKATGAFRVPSNGTVELTADFDARKSVVKAGKSGMYILKPTIRLITDNEAGAIAGAVSNIPEDAGDITIYAYEDGEYTDEEAAEPADEENRFPNAVSSSKVCEENRYRLSWLAPMVYDLIVVHSDNGEFIEVLGIVEDVEVTGRKTENQPIDIEELSSL